MHTRALVLPVAVFLAVCCTAAAIAGTPTRSTLPGTWTGSYGGAFSGTFTIHWRLIGTRLAGRITLSRPAGNYGISGSLTRGGGIRFGVVGAGATYKGTVSGKTMSGTYHSPQGDGTWSAKKSTS